MHEINHFDFGTHFTHSSSLEKQYRITGENYPNKPNRCCRDFLPLSHLLSETYLALIIDVPFHLSSTLIYYLNIYRFACSKYFSEGIRLRFKFSLCMHMKFEIVTDKAQQKSSFTSRPELSCKLQEQS